MDVLNSVSQSHQACFSWRLYLICAFAALRDWFFVKSENHNHLLIRHFPFFGFFRVLFNIHLTMISNSTYLRGLHSADNLLEPSLRASAASVAVSSYRVLPRTSHFYIILSRSPSTQLLLKTW